MDHAVARILSVHVKALLPPTAAEVDVKPQVETAAVIGIGLLYQGTGHHRTAEVLLKEMGRRPTDSSDSNVDRESFSLAGDSPLLPSNNPSRASSAIPLLVSPLPSPFSCLLCHHPSRASSPITLLVPPLPSPFSCLLSYLPVSESNALHPHVASLRCGRLDGQCSPPSVVCVVLYAHVPVRLGRMPDHFCTACPQLPARLSPAFCQTTTTCSRLPMPTFCHPMDARPSCLRFLWTAPALGAPALGAPALNDHLAMVVRDFHPPESGALVTV
jgi:hypothetical protein